MMSNLRFGISDGPIRQEKALHDLVQFVESEGAIDFHEYPIADNCPMGWWRRLIVIGVSGCYALLMVIFHWFVWSPKLNHVDQEQKL